MTTEQMEELKDLLADLEGECARVGVLLDNCENLTIYPSKKH